MQGGSVVQSKEKQRGACEAAATLVHVLKVLGPSSWLHSCCREAKGAEEAAMGIQLQVQPGLVRCLAVLNTSKLFISVSLLKQDLTQDDNEVNGFGLTSSWFLLCCLQCQKGPGSQV